MNRKGENGFTYIALLVLVAIWSIALCVTAEIFEKRRQQEIRAQLTWAAKQYTRAVESYYYSAPLGKRRLPSAPDELIEDKRFFPPARHLRSLYLTDSRNGSGLRPLLVGNGLVGAEAYGPDFSLQERFTPPPP